MCHIMAMAAIVLIVFPVLMAYAGVSDLLTMTIPNKLSLALAAVFSVLAAGGALSLDAIALHVAAGALVLAIGCALFACGWIGGGDAKLAAVTSLWLGFGNLLDYFFIASVGGGVLTLIVLVARGAPLPVFALGWRWLERIRMARKVPYGIALAASALIVYPHCEIWAAALAG
jgi:prepilin peptidase CpaA